MVLADANPAIIGLRTSTLLGLEEALNAAAAGDSYPDGAGAAPHTGAPGDPGAPAAREDGAGGPAGDEPPPNLGPPPERLDWRRPR